MPFTPKDWKDSPDTTTPIDQTALEDLEERLSSYADDGSDAAFGLLNKVDNSTRAASGLGYVNHGASAGVARPTGWAAILWLGSVEPSNAQNGDVWMDTT